MPLQSCPECRGQVSAAAATCPHCGHPLRQAAGGARAGAGAGARPGDDGSSELVLWEAAPTLRAFLLEAAVLVVAALALVSLAGPALTLAAQADWPGANIVGQHWEGLELGLTGLITSAAIGALGRLAWRAVGVRSHRYHLSNQRLVIESGVLSKTIREIDIRAVDDIMLKQSLLGRILDVGEIAIVASEPDAKGPRNKVRLLGVAQPRAVRETIRDAAYRATGGQVFVRTT